MTTLYWTGPGPKISYNGGILILEDLNPEQRMNWRMSRREMFVIGLRFIWVAIVGR